jgi:Calcineurin-like phosphoesterase
MKRAHLAGIALLLTLAILPHPRLGGETLQPPATRIVAVGDIHGEAAGLVQILQAAGLIDGKRRWSGGTARLVQTGDFTDRGAGVREVMDLLMRLEGEAKRAGGRVDVLFGNHEGMNLLHDLRDASPQAFAAFADTRSEDRRRRAFEAHEAIVKRAGGAIDRNLWMSEHPLGFVEYLQAIGPSGAYGRWIRGRKVVLKIDDSIFMHAGLSPESTTSLDEVNRTAEREIRAWDDLVKTLEQQRLVTSSFTFREFLNAAQVEIGRIGIALKTGEPPGDHVTREYVEQLQRLSTVNDWVLVAAEGPLWYRGLATLPETAQPQIDSLLQRHGAGRFVLGHTPQLPGRVKMRFGGKVVLIDTGMLASYYKGGQPSALEIQGGRLTAIYPSGRESF